MKRYFSLRKVCWFDCLRFEVRRYLRVSVRDLNFNLVSSTVTCEERKRDAMPSLLVDVTVSFSASNYIQRFNPNLAQFSILGFKLKYPIFFLQLFMCS